MNADPIVVICIRSAQQPVRSYPDPIRIIPVATDRLEKKPPISHVVSYCVSKKVPHHQNLPNIHLNI